MDMNVANRYALCTFLVLLLSGLALTSEVAMLPYLLAFLGSAAAVSSVWAISDYAGKRRTNTLVRSICSVDCTEEAYKSLIQILNRERISFSVRGHYTVNLLSPFRGVIELRKSVGDSYSDTHIDDLRTTDEFCFDLHETKYDVFRREKPAGTIIKARSQSRKDSESIKEVVSAVIGDLGLTTD